MEAKANYTVIGLIVVILICALLTTALWLSVGFSKKKYTIYAVHIYEAVSGLNEESPVKYNGVPVGSVLKIELSHTNPREVIILLNIVEGTPITTSTTATLISQGITGMTYVGLTAKSPKLTPLLTIPGEPYPIIPTEPSLLHQLDGVVKQVSDNINTISLRLKKIITTENAINLKHSLANLKIFTQVLAKHSDNIGRSLKNADITLQNIRKVSYDLPHIIKNLNDSITQLNKEITHTSNNISITMKSGKTALDKISNQTIPPIIILLHKLNNIADNIEKLSTELHQNPAVIIRGTIPPSSGPGER